MKQNLIRTYFALIAMLSAFSASQGNADQILGKGRGLMDVYYHGFTLFRMQTGADHIFSVGGTRRDVHKTKEILCILQTTFGKGNQNVQAFRSPVECINHLKDNRSKLKDTTLVTDLVFEDFDETGFDIIQTYQEFSASQTEAAKPILCTTLGDSAAIRELSQQYNVRVISKADLDKIKIKGA